MTHQEILAIEFDSMDLGSTTIKGYLLELLKAVWQEGEAFSGKRPFGNSWWRYDLHKPLIEHGLVDGTLDEEGYIDECDDGAANKLILELITSL